MHDKVVTLFTNITGRRYALVVAFVVVALGVTGVVRHTSKPADQHLPEPEFEEFALEAAEPTEIHIPKLSISAPFSAPLGLLDSGEIEVPEGYEEVAYYKYGPTPGEIGPAVVLGHVDSVDGPAVFYSLGQLQKGDPIEIYREDGTVATFIVTALERHSQDEFPTEKVYGSLDYAGLRLITCSGTYDKDELRYSHNLIIYARLFEE